MAETPIETIDNFDDRRLIEVVRTDPSAVSVLYRRHYETIARYVSRRVATRNDVNDIVSEVFLVMVREIDRYRWTGVPFQCWLFRIASSQINRWVRTRKWTRFWAPFEDQAVIVDKDTSCESSRVLLLRKCLLELPCRYQNALALYHLEELSVKQIAEILNATETAVKSRLSRGRELLRRKINAYEKLETKNERRTTRCVLERNEA
ncbi:MAG: RNA polymerase sigma factor [Pirellulales bacterium]